MAFFPGDIAQLSAKPVLGVDELSALTGIPENTLFALWRRGDGPLSFKAGRRRMTRREDLDKWMAERVRRATSEPA